MPNLVSEGQEIVVDPQKVHRSDEQLGEVTWELSFGVFPYRSRFKGTTLIENLERSVKSRT